MADILSLVGGGMAMSSTALLAAGLRGRRRSRSIAASPPPVSSGAMPSPMTDTDIADLCTRALRDAEADAERQFVSLRLAAVPGLVLRVDAAGLGAAVRAMLDAAVRAAPCGTVLLSVARHGGRIAIAVTDDGPADPRRRDALAPIGATAAWHGATVEVERRQGGTVTALRLLDRIAQPSRTVARAPIEADVAAAAEAREMACANAP